MEQKHKQVGQLYDGEMFEYEFNRLTIQSPVEFATTTRLFMEHIQPKSKIVEAGVGVGTYTELLARHDCYIKMLDVSQKLLDTTEQRLRSNQLEHLIAGKHLCSATNMEQISNEWADAVLLLGPLYHLQSLEERKQTVKECYRVLRKGGIIFAAAVNKLSYLRDLLKGNAASPREVLKRNALHQRFIQFGILEAEEAPIGPAHLSTIKELTDLFDDSKWQKIDLIGTESFTNGCEMEFNRLNQEEKDAFMKLVHQTCSSQEALGMSDHFLFVGRKI